VRAIVLIALLATLAVVFAAAWLTRGAVGHLSQAARGPKTIVDGSPWLTAQTLAAMAVTAEENGYARQAERLADHEVDQAFASALREAGLRVQHRTLSGEALSISQRIDQLKQLTAQDQATVNRLEAAQPHGNASEKPSEDSGEDTDLTIAKAQLALDSDELADANRDLERTTGDERPAIQSELAAREASMKKYDSEVHEVGQVAALSAGRYGTLAGRIGSWNRQRARLNLLQQAQQQAQSDALSLTAKHNQLEGAVNASQAGAPATQDRSAQLTGIKNRSAQRQLLSIYGDRIQTEQQLGEVYRKWAMQVQVQHRVLLHLILQSVAWLLLILVAMVFGDTVVRRLMEHTRLDPRQRQTLRAVLGLVIQLIGLGCIVLVVFGAPRQTPTILGLTTAALTIALQDFVLAFFGWFVLMGKKGIRVGDTVEIDGVGGEVTEIGVMSTTLLETGLLTEGGNLTGRRITFMNGFAIRGKFFNFSTAGQWMTDQFELELPGNRDMHGLSEQILKMVEQETAESVRQAEQEWKRSLPREALQRMRAPAIVNLRPTGAGFYLQVRYVTRASERFETRNRLYRRVVELLDQSEQAKAAQTA
jgi:small-conductance mechanosensitive channel